VLRIAPIGRRAGIETPWIWGAATTLAFSVSFATEITSFTLVGVAALSTHLPLHVGLLAAWGVAAFLWGSARAAGRVGEGSEAGLRLAIYALAARDVCETLVLFAGLQGVDLLREPIGPVAAFLPHATLVVFGYGLALAASVSVLDAVRRRRHAAWMLVPYRLVEPMPLPGFVDPRALPPRLRRLAAARRRAKRRGAADHDATHEPARD
jgi:hypothetical protein